MIPKVVAGLIAALVLGISAPLQAKDPPCLSWPVRGPRATVMKFNDPHYPFRKKYGAHNGLDIVAAQGTPIYAPARGEVVWTWPDSYGASYISVIMPTGRYYELVHVSLIAVRPGQRVRRGQFLGRTGGAVGAPGSGKVTTGPHLHFNLLNRRLKPVDPEPHFCPSRP